MKLALILGANGQDGSYLTDLLLNRGYRVIGADRHETTLHPVKNSFYHYFRVDLRNKEELSNFIALHRPDKLFHVAAVHGSSGTEYEVIWQNALAVNMGSVHIILEYMRLNNPEMIFIYANSGKIYGPNYPKNINESSQMKAKCLYTITKMGAHNLISYYRLIYGLKASSLFLFNHESERRPKDFFIPKVLSILALSLKNKNIKEKVNSLDFFCDWGSAEEFMDIAIDISENAPGEDFILATGKTWYARDLLAELFQRHGLDYCDHITIEKHKHNQHDIQDSYYKVNNGKLKKYIKRIPTIDILDQCDNILTRYLASD